MSEKVLISIVIPVYNVEDYLERCLESVVKQTYKNLEILVINDGSLDNSRDIAKKYEQIDDRIKVFDKENGGLSDARNYGISKIKGSLLFLLDSDDFIAPTALEDLYAIHKKSNAQIVVGNYVNHYGEKGISVFNNKPGLDYQVYETEDALEKLLYQKGVTTSAWGKLYESSLFEDIQYPYGAICEDLDVTYKLFSKSKHVAVSPNVYLFYQQREGSIIRSKFNMKRFEAMDFAKKQLDFININYPELSDAAVNRLMMEAFYIAIQLPKNEFEDVRKEVETVIEWTSKVVYKDSKATKKQRLIAMISRMSPKLGIIGYRIKAK